MVNYQRVHQWLVLTRGISGLNLSSYWCSGSCLLHNGDACIHSRSFARHSVHTWSVFMHLSMTIKVSLRSNATITLVYGQLLTKYNKNSEQWLNTKNVGHDWALMAHSKLMNPINHWNINPKKMIQLMNSTHEFTEFSNWSKQVETIWVAALRGHRRPSPRFLGASMVRRILRSTLVPRQGQRLREQHGARHQLNNTGDQSVLQVVS